MVFFGSLPKLFGAKAQQSLSVDVQVRIVVNPFTPKGDQCQISPAASPEIYYITQYEEVGF